MARQPGNQGTEDDDSLMVAIAGGDRLAMRTVMQRQLPALLGLGRHMLRDGTEAEDVAQEAFVRLWKNADKWRPGEARIGTWLHRVATNLCIDRLRRKSHGANTPLDQVAEPLLPPDQLRGLQETDLKARVAEALDTLPERQRTALVLCHFQGLSQAEAGEVLEASVEAVESLLARARRTLKQKLAGEWRALLPDPPDFEGGEVNHKKAHKGRVE